MSTIKHYEDIEAWKLGRKLASATYRITNRGDFRKDWALRDQMRRAAVSVVSNIAEGFNRNGTVEFRQHLSQAKGSAAELQAQLYVAVDVGYIDQDQFRDLYRLVGEIQNLIGGFLRYLSTSPLRGSKFSREPRTQDPGPRTELPTD